MRNNNYDWGGDDENENLLILPENYKPLKMKQAYSVFANLTKTKKEDIVLSYDINSLLDLFKGENFYRLQNDPKTSKLVQNIKEVKNFDKKTQKAAYDTFKRYSAPVCNLNYTGLNDCTIKNVNKENLSDYFYFDIDGFDTKEEAEDTKQAVFRTGKIAAVWLSASGYGIGGLIRISWLKDVLDYNRANADYKIIFDFVWKEAGLSAFTYDTAAVTLERRTVVSYDPKLLRTSGLGYDPDVIEKPSQEALDALRTVSAPLVQKAVKEGSQAKIKPFTGVLKTLNNADRKLLELVYIEAENCNSFSTKVKNNNVEKPSEKFFTNGERFRSSVKEGGYHSAPLLLLAQAVKYGFSLDDVYSFLLTAKDFLKGERSWSIDANVLSKQLEKCNDYKWIIDAQNQGYNDYCLYNEDSVEVLEEGQFFSDKVNFENYNGENFKIYVNSSTGSGKTFGSLKYVKDAQNAGQNLKAILCAPLLNIGLNIEKDAKTLGLSFVRFDSTTSTKWTSELSKADVIFTTYASLSKLSSELFYSRTALIEDYVLFIDEAHTINEDGYKDKESFESLLKLKDNFKRLFYLTGTPQNTSFDLKTTEVVNCRKPLKIEKTFGFVKQASTTAKEVELILDYIKRGYFPFVYKNNTNETGWLGSLKALLSINGVNALTVNSKEKGSPEYDKLITSQKLNTELYQAVISTSVIREGVSFYTDKPQKIVYIFFSTTGAPTAEQFVNRTRNAESIEALFVYEEDFDENKYFSAENLKSFQNYKRTEYGVLEQAKAEYDSIDAQKLRYWAANDTKPVFTDEQKKSESLLNEKGQICLIGVTQKVRTIMNALESKSPYHCFWALKQYGFTFKSTSASTEEVLTEGFTAKMKEVRKKEKAVYTDAVSHFTSSFKSALNAGGSLELKKELYFSLIENADKKYASLVYKTGLTVVKFFNIDEYGFDNTSTFVEEFKSLGKTSQSHNKFIEKYRTFAKLYRLENNLELLPSDLKLLTFCKTFMNELKTPVLSKKELVLTLKNAFKESLPKVVVKDEANPKKAKAEKKRQDALDYKLTESIENFLEAYDAKVSSITIEGKKGRAYSFSLKPEYKLLKTGFFSFDEVIDLYEENEVDWTIF